MKFTAQTIAMCSLCTLLGCAEEPPPPTVDDYLADSVLLEATMVRCSANRSSTKYEPECVNAREAINRIARAEEAERRAQLEAQSERKRRALRRTQEAAAAARRRAAEAERLRQEAAYLSQFDAPADGSEGVPPPGAIVNPGGAPAMPDPQTSTIESTIESTNVESMNDPQPDAVPVQEPISEPTPAGGDLDAIREELRRRQDGSQ